MDRVTTAEVPQLLATMIRGAVEGDAELLDLLDEARRRRLPQLATLRLPPSLCPADFTEAALARIPERTPAPVWGFGITNPWATWIALNIRRRVAEIITGTFDQLRTGTLGAAGLQAATGANTCVPCRLWCSPAVEVDTRTNALLAGSVPLFLAVEVQPPAARAALSEAAARRYLDRFAAKLEAAGQLFSAEEASVLLQQSFPRAPMAAGRQVTRMLREMKPAAWATGRRRAGAKPTAETLAEAHREAFLAAFAL